MRNIKITDSIINIGANDRDIKLFESQYEVPNGMSYNSYFIKDEKNVVLDTVDKKVTNKWLENLEKELNGEKIDYLVISHLEPDHAYYIGLLAQKYPHMKLIGNAITFNILPNFFEMDLTERKIVVKEGETLNIGKHTLQFFMAPMVHWPEVMVTYEQTEQIVFTADGFGKFGALETKEDWDDEARRYYFGIVGKYGAQVQALLKKIENLKIKMICPLHGPILKENLTHYIEKYKIWSSYQPEEDGVFIACASIYGNTLEVAKKLKERLEEKGVNRVILMDLVKDDRAKAIENAFRYDKMILAASSYNAGVFVPMEQFLHQLKDRNYQNRKIGIVENGSWAPSAAKSMKGILQEMKDIHIVEPIVTIKATMKKENREPMEKLIERYVRRR